jgi:signal transduction histidine kinase
MIFIWSIITGPLKATLLRIQDPIQQARLKMFYFVFLLNFVKITGLFSVAIIQQDSKKLLICALAVVITIIILKLLVTKPQYLTRLIHLGILTGIFFLFNSSFYLNSGLTILTIQTIFMVCMWSFYALEGKWGFFYSIIATIPLFYDLLVDGNISMPVDVVQTYFFLYMTAINLAITFTTHYYYKNILFQTIKTKERLLKELEDVNKSQSLFFSSMSHELRTPLNSVIGMTNILIDGNENKEQRENLDILKFSAENLLSLINNILDLNKIDLGKVELEKINFNLHQLMQNACAGLKMGALEKKLDFILVVDPLLEHKNVTGDPTRLLQIILNLGSNAIKFTKNGLIKIEVQVVERVNDVVTIRFSVEDTGVGMSAEEQKHVFEPFTQASVQTTRKFGGTGLGLSIVKELVNLHHSRIQVKSELNVGTAFNFDIDYTLTTVHADLQDLSVSLVESSNEVLELRVLLAEDNFMKKLFSKWGIKLDVAENGLEVIKALEVNDYDVILMDLQMPIMDGYEATATIRKMSNLIKANIHIIALTASISEDLSTTVKEVGMNDMLNKPFMPQKLYETFIHPS